MERGWVPPARWIFAAATLLGLFSTLQAYRLTSLDVTRLSALTIYQLLALNLAYWYVPATLTPTIFRLAARFRLDTPDWLRSLAIHAVGAGAFSIVHAAAMMGVRAMMWPNAGKSPAVSWALYSQRMYLTNLDWALMTYSAIVGLSYALRYHRESQERAVKAAHLETRLVEARLRTLEAELHPHFLFNTLHAISTLVHSNPESADRMISRLSDLLRLTFDRSGAAGVSLQDELEFLQKYLEIEQTRFQDRLTVRFQIDPDTLDADVPKMILQPLVENAIKHGVSPRPGPGLIEVTTERRGGLLVLRVRDNGIGLSALARERLTSGVGLSNTRDRLECLYGTAHRLEFSERGGGLTVEMEIPYQRVPGISAAEAASCVA